MEVGKKKGEEGGAGVSCPELQKKQNVPDRIRLICDVKGE